jgi:hypothetical protein
MEPLQLTQLRIVSTKSPLRQTVAAEGPVRLKSMFEVGSFLIQDVGDGAVSANSKPAVDEKLLKVGATPAVVESTRLGEADLPPTADQINQLTDP